jgi:hypothetical protein
MAWSGTALAAYSINPKYSPNNGITNVETCDKNEFVKCVLHKGGFIYSKLTT